MDRLHTLLDRSQGKGPALLPTELRELYDGDLQWTGHAGAEAAAGADASSRGAPHVIANFVVSLDGLVSYKLPQRSGGAPISGYDPVDHFIMGLLRASADAVIVGAGTLHDASPDTLWTAQQIYPAAAPIYAAYQRALGKLAPPLTVIVSTSGLLDLRRAVFQTPGSRALIMTTPSGRERLASTGVDIPADLEVQELQAVNGHIDPLAILEHLGRRGVRLLLHEGGPTLFADFLAAGAVNELFLTIAPQTIGRGSQTRRPGLVQGLEFLPEGAPWFSLISIKCSEDQLYLRYRCTGPRTAAAAATERRDRPTRDP